MFQGPFPILSTADLDRAVRFYRDVLGFQPEYRFPETGEPDFVTLVLDTLKLGLGRDPEVHTGRHFALWLNTDDVDEALDRLRGRGVAVLQEPQDMPWGERVATVADPDGNPVHLGAPLVRH